MAFIFQYRNLRRFVKGQLEAAGDPSEESVGIPSKEADRYTRIPGISLQLDYAGQEYFQVDWATPSDPFCPQQWSTTRRVFATLSVCLIALVTTMASSIDAAVMVEAAAEFGVSEVTESLATGLYLVGFGVGALIASPLSEMIGRYPVYLGALTIFGAWILGAALAPNIGAQLTFRFLAGLVGSAPLTVAGGSISDVWNTLEKTFGFPVFAIPGFGGPILGMHIFCLLLNGTNARWYRPSRWSVHWVQPAHQLAMVRVDDADFGWSSHCHCISCKTRDFWASTFILQGSILPSGNRRPSIQDQGRGIRRRSKITSPQEALFSAVDSPHGADRDSVYLLSDRGVYCAVYVLGWVSAPVALT
jgi:hypothetical protein